MKRLAGWLVPFCAIPLMTAQTPPAAGELTLSLQEAAQLATAPDGATRVQLAAAMVRRARAESQRARSAFLPHVEGSATAQSTMRNLEAFGVRLAAPAPGVQFPRVVGPFSVYDGRLTATQSIFDLSAIRRFEASKSAQQAAADAERNAGDEVTADVARAYFSALRAQERVRTAEADIELALSLRDSAVRRNEAGVGTRIEITRAEVQLANERQKLTRRREELRGAHLALARRIGLDLSVGLRLTTPLAEPAAEPAPLEASLAEALELRDDYKAQQERLESARRRYSSAKWERLPTVAVFADYGSIGSTIGAAQPTRTLGASLRVPLFDGGRLQANRSEQAAALHEEELRAEDLRDQIELEVRLSRDRLLSAAQQLEPAEQGLELAEDELEQAVRRYEAGVGDSLEVTGAQTRLARARQNRVDALFAYNVAAVDWAQARGRIETVLR